MSQVIAVRGTRTSRGARAALLLCGVDEAGRGPIAGPVYAAAVILDRRRRIRGLDDSKRLAASVRLELAALIRERALAWSIASASVEEIDALNILRATLLAMKRAVETLRIAPEEIVVDGLHCPDVSAPARALVGGDATIGAVSAASILAKTARDAEMLRLHAQFPGYGFDRHKGYPTPEHLAALRRLGPCDIYRRSFAPVRALAGTAGPRRQTELL
ncbi:MAG: ribonuclease HII [Burkholderiales bacterium]|nr:ribonuclease HII [Burkholderiales bacterium]